MKESLKAVSRFSTPVGAAILVLFTCILTGCRVAKIPGQAVQMITSEPGRSVQTDPSLLQQDIFRFCDEFGNHMSAEFNELLRNDPAFNDSDLIKLKLSLNYRLLEIAAGSNDYVNLCDLVCLVALSRYAVERHPVVLAAGSEGEEVIRTLQAFESRVYTLATATFGEDASRDLQQKVSAWLPGAFRPGAILYSHYSGLASEIGNSTANTDNPQMNILGALMLDPLAGLDPTRREILQTRLFAERAMFVSQRMPKIIRMEGELVSFRLIESPEVKLLITDVNSLTQSIERVSKVAETLPDTVREEREAVFAGLNEQTPELTRLVEATSTAVDSTNVLVGSVDMFLEHLGVYDAPEAAANPPASTENAPPSGEPFRIQDYTEAAAQLSQTAEQLNLLVTSLDHALATATSEEVVSRLDLAMAHSRDLLDLIFWRAVLLIAISCFLVLVTILVSRKLGRFRSQSRGS